ncbi:nucleotidyltransferase domain-containing protein [Parahaliea mediterranea]|uniref:Nucleotidyltransferase family protein n=1 Tax=Parahaliea mediterranea TaxID=651086 RepID=A0A939IJB0_9GAMM|nr:nucleotidyltransferase family protein [Parahaliea mediterranea]MBN7797459.1 nucleotidyltransferase family protein [Parahaliea mediterranea]
MSIQLIELLRSPERAARLGDRDWDRLIPQARLARLLGSLYHCLDTLRPRPAIPEKVWRHLYAGHAVHVKQCRSLHFELRKLGVALAEAGERVVLLKGGAYILAGLPAASGRLISDIDILVQASNLHKVEAALGRHGWTSGSIDPYNDRYYRQWMHEIPPLGHGERHSTLDVHHTILPPTSDSSIDPEALWSAMVEAAPGVWMLAPVDMVLHSAAHLFHEGEFDHGLRDLLDLDRLLRHFAATEGEAFFPALAARAREMGLQRPLFYALRYTRRFLGTPVPDGFSRELLPRRPTAPGRRLMDFLFLRAFTPNHSSCRLPFTAPALFCLYVRSHYLRMPLRLLLPHLARKAWMDLFPAAPDRGEKAQGQAAGG